MSDTTDNELILFHYRDGLSNERLVAIETELAASTELRARYEKLRTLLDATNREPVPEPAPDFEGRMWERVQARLAADMATPQSTTANSASAPARLGQGRWRNRPRPRSPWRLTLAAVAALVFVMFLAERFNIDTLVEPVAGPQRAVLSRSDASQRVLAVEVSAHLRATESVLTSVMNSDSAMLDSAASDLASTLAESNRMYALAAARSGNKPLAGFLTTLEPVLIELANPGRPGSIQDRQRLRDFVRSADFLFQVRALEARLQVTSG